MKRFTLILTAALMVIPAATYGWTKTYGGENWEQGNYVQPTADGGYIVVGTASDSPVAYTWGDLWLLKTDASGDTVWSRRYRKDNVAMGIAVFETADAGYMVFGNSTPSTKGWLLKTDSAGDTLWTQDYSFLIQSVQPTYDGGYILAADGLVKLDSQGSILWSNSNSYYDSGVAYAEETDGGGFILTGSKCTFWLAKTDSAGDTLWTKLHGVFTDCGCCIRQTSDGGYIASGFVDWDLGRKYYVVRTDSAGEFLWEYNPLYFGLAHTVYEVEDGEYIAAGIRASVQTGGYLVKLDDTGDTVWTRTYGFSPNEFTWIDKTDDDGLILTGQSEGNLWVVKTDSTGLAWSRTISPVTVLEPEYFNVHESMFPAARFTNQSKEEAADFYCHCEIEDRYNSDTSDYYHDSVLVSSPLVPGESIDIEFSEWVCQEEPDSSFPGKATFYAAKEDDEDFGSLGLYKYFTGYPAGIDESGIVVKGPFFKVSKPVGSRIAISYANYPQGFHASVFDASGRKVDVLNSTGKSGTITWEGHGPGVYFIVPETGGDEAQKVVLVR
ncbi:hypothetical protein GF359_00410 [candidate division WOR-3 bacterium]|uniref:T9SS type A sorting domain-containing protein n=1 Tax=candidate division WOR-3 bacterium TaxID=2052148 RepID=A0A9D5K8M6_UNCW3|nr:hypothetical protein [candidate division WOR-3 bacterium]MBD3363655.1 hypothetical protein [candidate division WOR-3 bacterium]